MKQSDLVTLEDLLALEARLNVRLDALKENLQEADGKAFYTPREFSERTGLTYHCVIKRCKNGHLKAHQDRPGSCWVIDGSEIARLRESAARHKRIGRAGVRRH